MLFDIDFIKKINIKNIGRIWKKLLRASVSGDADSLKAIFAGLRDVGARFKLTGRTVNL